MPSLLFNQVHSSIVSNSVVLFCRCAPNSPPLFCKTMQTLPLGTNPHVSFCILLVYRMCVSALLPFRFAQLWLDVRVSNYLSTPCRCIVVSATLRCRFCPDVLASPSCLRRTFARVLILARCDHISKQNMCSSAFASLVQRPCIWVVNMEPSC